MEQFDFPIVLPEIALSLYAMLALLVAVYTTKDGLARIVTWATVAVMLALAAWIGVTGRPEGVAFGGAIVADAFSRFAMVTILLAAAGVLAMCESHQRKSGQAAVRIPDPDQSGRGWHDGDGVGR